MVVKGLKKYVPKVGGGASIRTDTGKYVDIMITALGRVYADVHYVGKKEPFQVHRKELESPLFPDVNTRFAYFERLAYYTLIRKTKALLVVGKSGLGKCLKKGTLIRMADLSLQAIETVKVGDCVLGEDGEPRKVLGLSKGYSELYKITQNNGMSYTVNESHILSLKHRLSKHHRISDGKGGRTYTGCTTTYETLDIPIKDYLSKSKFFKKNCYGYKAGLMEFSEKPITIDPYFLGLWLGDGNSHNTTITNGEVEVCEWLNNFATSNRLEYWCKELEKVNSIAHYFNYNESLLRAFRGYELIPNTPNSREKLKHIPNEYLTNSVSVRRKILAGILDTDGYLVDNCYDIVQKSKEFAKDIETLCKSLGLHVCRSTQANSATNGTIGNLHDYERLTISGEGLELLPMIVKRKKAGKRKQIKNALHTGITVDYDSYGEYYGIEIDGNKRHCLEDFTVTHNTYSVEQIIAREGLVENEDFIYIKGYSSAKALYDTLCEYKDDVLIIDDCDSVFTDKIAVNIIKAALDVFAKRRIVSWRTGGTQGGKVKSFEFTGSVLFISNLPIEDIAAAIISRTKIVDLFMTVPETIERMRFLLPYLSAGDDKPLTIEEKGLVLDLLDKYQHNINDFNVRTLLKAFETFYLYGKDDIALDATKFQVIQG